MLGLAAEQLHADMNRLLSILFHQAEMGEHQPEKGEAGVEGEQFLLEEEGEGEQILLEMEEGDQIFQGVLVCFLADDGTTYTNLHGRPTPITQMATVIETSFSQPSTQGSSSGVVP